MKAHEFLIIPRSEIEGRLNQYRASYAEPENFAEYRMLQDMEAESRPLSPILEKTWEAASEATRFNAPPPFKALETAKELFLTSDL